MNKQNFINKLKETLPENFKKYNYDLLSQTFKYRDKIPINCFNHGLFYQKAESHLYAKTNCPKCVLEANKFTQEQFIAKSKIIHGDLYEYDKVKYETNISKVIITCKKHGDFIQRASSHLAGCKCNKCYIESNRKPPEEFIKIAKLVHGNNYDYSKVKYYGNKQPVEIICPNHGSFWQKPNSHTSSKNGCRFCYESKGERSIEMFLKKFNIKYIREYRFLPYLYRYDFYLPDFNIYIEYNGIQHYKAVEIFGGELAYLKTKENDKIKKQIVLQNNEHLININYLRLNESSMENELICQLKRINKFWFVIDNKIQVFKLEMDLYKFFRIPLSVLLRDLVIEVSKVVKNFSVLF